MFPYAHVEAWANMLTGKWYAPCPIWLLCISVNLVRMVTKYHSMFFLVRGLTTLNCRLVRGITTLPCFTLFGVSCWDNIYHIYYMYYTDILFICIYILFKLFFPLRNQKALLLVLEGFISWSWNAGIMISPLYDHLAKKGVSCRWLWISCSHVVSWYHLGTVSCHLILICELQEEVFEVLAKQGLTFGKSTKPAF